MSNPEAFMRRAIELSHRASLEYCTGGAFGAVLVQDVRFLKARTVYSRIGDVAGWLSVAFTAAALLATRGKVK